MEKKRKKVGLDWICKMMVFKHKVSMYSVFV